MELDERTRSSVAAYDQHADAWQRAFRLKRPITEIRRFADAAGKGALVADIGCGPGSDLRLLTDAGVRPVGVDYSLGALRHARLLMPRHPLVRASMHDLPFEPDTFDGLWLSSAFTHLPRVQWPTVFSHLMTRLRGGPVFFSCYRGRADMELVDDPVLGPVHRSQAMETEVERLLASHGLVDITVEVRGDPIVDRRRPWVMAMART